MAKISLTAFTAVSYISLALICTLHGSFAEALFNGALAFLHFWEKCHQMRVQNGGEKPE
jgi:hypothetical protein